MGSDGSAPHHQQQRPTVTFSCAPPRAEEDGWNGECSVCVCERVWVHSGVEGDHGLWYCFNSWHWERKGLRACVWGVQSGLGQGFCVCKCVRAWVCVLQGVYLQVLYRHCEALKVSPWGCPSTNSNYQQITEIMGDPAVKNLTPLAQTLSLLLFLPHMAILQPSSYLGCLVNVRESVQGENEVQGE